MRHIPAAIGLAFLIWYFVRTRKVFRSRKERVTNTMAFAIAVVTFAIPYINDVLPRAPDPDYIALNRAYLNAELIIDGISSNSVRYHYVVENIGKLPAAGLWFAEKSPVAAAIGGLGGTNTVLAPASKIVVYKGSNGSVPADQSEAVWGFRLYCAYVSDVAGKTISYRDDFVFTVDPSGDTQDRHGWEKCVRSEGAMDAGQLREDLGVTAGLDGEIGTYCVWFDVESNAVPHLLAKSMTKRLTYDPATTCLVYETVLLGENHLLVKYPLPSISQKWQMVGIAWDRTNGSLYHNGEKAMEFVMSPSPEVHPTKQSSVPVTRGTPPAKAGVAPESPVR